MKKKEVCLVLDSSYKIKYESISEFENSLFSEVYAKAVQIIQEIQKKTANIIPKVHSATNAGIMNKSTILYPLSAEEAPGKHRQCCHFMNT